MCSSEAVHFNDVNWATALHAFSGRRKKGLNPWEGEAWREKVFAGILQHLAEHLEDDFESFAPGSTRIIAASLAKIDRPHPAIFRAITSPSNSSHLANHGLPNDIALVARAVAKLEVPGAREFMESLDPHSKYIVTEGAWDDVAHISSAFEKVYYPFGGGGWEWWRAVHEHEVYRGRVEREREERGGRFGRL